MRLQNCHNFQDFRTLAKQRLPSPIFNYIDGAADDETTYRQNTASFERCDLVPNVLRGVETVDMSVTVLGQKLAMPVYCSPTALQRLFHHQGERAVAAAAAEYGTMFGVSSLGTVSLEELRKAHDAPQVYQFYFHKDRGLNRAMMQRAKEAGVNVMMLTVDNRPLPGTDAKVVGAQAERLGVRRLAPPPVAIAAIEIDIGRYFLQTRLPIPNATRRAFGAARTHERF
jgi:L-lactate dehydrogenase (cytochrome)